MKATTIPPRPLGVQRFVPEIEILGRLPQPIASIEELEATPSMYSASPAFALKHGGRLVEKILSAIPADYYEECSDRELLPNIDVRVHRLYKGIFPAFPGWHCDGEFRETYFSQPDLDRTPVSKTVVCTISSHEDGVSNTEFLVEPFTASIVDGDEQNVWRQVHDQVSANMPLRTMSARDGDLIQFSNRTLHRARPAERRGWRLFFRMSMWHKPYLGLEGKLAKQEQVYQVVEGLGW